MRAQGGWKALVNKLNSVSVGIRLKRVVECCM